VHRVQRHPLDGVKAMNPYDPIKAIREELVGLTEVEKSIKSLVRGAEAKLGQAEAELFSARKVEGFLNIEIQRKRDALKQLEDERDGPKD
jgi:hypothetical protein